MASSFICTAKWIVRYETTQFAVGATDHSTLGSNEMRLNKMSDMDALKGWFVRPEDLFVNRQLSLTPPRQFQPTNLMAAV